MLICVGNTCRSPMAGGLLEEILRRSGTEAEIRTAGLSPGVGVNPRAVKVMKEIGIDISSHRPGKVTSALVNWADYVIPLTRELGEDLVELLPAASAKIRWLDKDIDDPVSEQSASRYRETRDQLRAVLAVLARGLRQ
ncbi:MAG: low molecular weight phosphatase family protein [Candidatus Rokubacteria bacterium]|nr:low molecular weight phosphatase family protein [Candidatus Rokubacteria bacterium]